jgi:hypothetical protein
LDGIAASDPGEAYDYLVFLHKLLQFYMSEQHGSLLWDRVTSWRLVMKACANEFIIECMMRKIQKASGLQLHLRSIIRMLFWHLHDWFLFSL